MTTLLYDAWVIKVNTGSLTRVLNAHIRDNNLLKTIGFVFASILQHNIIHIQANTYVVSGQAKSFFPPSLTQP